MRNIPLKRVFGATLLLISLVLVLVVFVYPFSKLLGKGKVEFESPVTSLDSTTPSLILPVFVGLKNGSPERPKQVFLTISKLGIQRAPVRLDILVNNLRPDYLNALLTGLAHLRGSVYPGQKGNSIVFGHSALPYLYNPNDFQTIFTKLDELKFGDPILVEVDSRIFRFRVEQGGLIDDHTLLNDLASRKPRLTLLTCYPPGYKIYRFAVRALLEE